MNVFKKIYCRVFQTVFKLALPILPYRKPKVIDSVLQVAEELKKADISRVLIVTDAKVRGLGLTAPLEADLIEKGVEYSLYDATRANPTTEDVETARKIYLNEGCQALIAFGGGSPIDCAKAVGARIARPKKSLSKMEGILKVGRKIPLMVAIPTTAGTGSETTLAAVITDSVTRHKYPINDFPLIPKLAVLDPTVTLSLPPSLTATTGLDALTHAVEAYIGRSTTKGTRRDAVEAVKLIFDNLKIAYDNGQNVEARRNMLKAAFKAGSAFSKSYVGYVHAVAHSLGGKYNTPHGLANSVLLPVVLVEYGKSAHRKLARLGVASGVVASEGTYSDKANAFINAILELSDSLGIPRKLDGIDHADIPKLALTADKEANPLYPVPRLWNAEKLEKFYYSVSASSEKN